MSGNFFSLITLFSGVILGFISSYLLSWFNFRREVSKTIINQYFKAREELSNVICKLATLNIDNKLDESSIKKACENISTIYAKFFDVLPDDVIVELDCLYYCLSDEKGTLYTKKTDIVRPIETDKELEEFVTRILPDRNSRYIAIIALKTNNLEKRRVAAINYQSRCVIFSMTKTFSIRYLISLKWINKRIGHIKKLNRKVGRQ